MSLSERAEKDGRGRGEGDRVGGDLTGVMGRDFREEGKGDEDRGGRDTHRDTENT